MRSSLLVIWFLFAVLSCSKVSDTYVVYMQYEAALILRIILVISERLR